MIETPSMLITDDDGDLLDTLADVFRAKGFEIFPAGDGEEALEILAHQPIHLMLMDMHMPRLNGLEAIRRARKKWGQIPSILMSAAMDEALAAQARDAEVFSVLAKPISCQEVTHLVFEAMKARYGWPSST